MTTEWGDGHFLAGDVALDLANTVFRRWPELGADLLTGPDDLGTWLTRTGLLAADEGGATAVTDADVSRARTLRGHLWAAFDAQRDGTTIPAGALSGLLDTARAGSAHIRVGADGALATTDATGALAVVALRATALVLGPPPQGVRACDRCGWLFVDSSRGRRRRWCSMETCGNRAKAARYRAAHS